MAGLKKSAAGHNSGSKRWDDDLKADTFGIPNGKPTRIRLFNATVVVPQHYVEFYSEKKKGKTGFYGLCLNWDYDAEGPAEKDCPYCEQGIRLSRYVYGYMISRVEQKKGNLQVRPIRLTEKCASDILKLTDIVYDEGWPDGFTEDPDAPGGPDATDPKFGFDIMINQESVNGKTEYKVNPATGGPAPLTKEETRAFRDYVAQFPYGEMAQRGLQTVKEIQQGLTRLKITPADDAKSSGGGAKKAKSADYSAYDDEVPEEDQEAAPVKTSKKKPSAEEKPKKKAALTDDDDDDGGSGWADDDDDEVADKKTTRTYASADDSDEPDEEE